MYIILVLLWGQFRVFKQYHITNCGNDNNRLLFSLFTHITFHNCLSLFPLSLSLSLYQRYKARIPLESKVHNNFVWHVNCATVFNMFHNFVSVNYTKCATLSKIIIPIEKQLHRAGYIGFSDRQAIFNVTLSVFNKFRIHFYLLLRITTNSKQNSCYVDGIL